MTIIDVSMKQLYGFLVFSDASGVQLLGIRADSVSQWELVVATPPTARYTRTGVKLYDYKGDNKC